ncbi:MAG: hypothetical protein ACK559_14290, partial [bacterium]
LESKSSGCLFKSKNLKEIMDVLPRKDKGRHFKQRLPVETKAATRNNGRQFKQRPTLETTAAS